MSPVMSPVMRPVMRPVMSEAVTPVMAPVVTQVLGTLLRGALCAVLLAGLPQPVAGAEHAAAEPAPAEHAAAAPAGPRPPFELTRSLQALQDQMVLGSHAAGAAQKALLVRIGDEFSKAPKSVWREPANARAAIVYVLSGGWPHFLQRLIHAGSLPDAEADLARGALAYATGRRDEAWAGLRAVEARALPPLLGAHVALVQASLTMERDPASAAGYLETARLLAPGTLIEDAALRREVSVASDMANAERFTFLARQYIRRFARSVYAPNLVRAFPQLWAGLGLPNDADSFMRLEATVAGLDPASRGELYLALARHRLVAGDTVLAGFAAARAAELAEAGSSEAMRAALYGAAAEVAGGGSARAVERLRGVDPARLSRPDAELQTAALAVADQVWREAPLKDATPREAVEFEASAVLQRASAAIAAADALLRRTR